MLFCILRELLHFALALKNGNCYKSHSFLRKNGKNHLTIFLGIVDHND